MKHLAIIGGGAAGLAAAVEAGAQARKADVDVCVTVYEADERVGRPILRSGNGRCNFSNAHIQADLYHNAAFVGDALLHVQRDLKEDQDPVAEFFANYGLVWTEETDGRRYPATGKAATVLNVLRAAAADLGVEERCGSAVRTVDPPQKLGGRYTLRLEDGEMVRADAVIVAVGGEVARDIVAVDLPFEPIRPMLGPLDARLVLADEGMNQRGKGGKGKSKAKDNDLLNLNNIRVDGQVTLLREGWTVHEEAGEILFRKYGVSGIVVFNTSRYAQPGDLVEVDLVPWIEENDLSPLFALRKRLMGHLAHTLTWEDMLRGLAVAPVAQVVTKCARVTLNQPFEKSDVSRLAAALKHLRLQVEGVHNDESQCQVHRGGFSVDAVSPADCQVGGCPGLYIVGEALDVDGPCGGFNLHWAWVSGMLAARSAVSVFADATGVN